MNNQEPLFSWKEVAEAFGHDTELENRIGLSFDAFAQAVQEELQKPDLTSNQRASYTALLTCVRTMAEQSRQASDEERWRTFDKSSTERCSIGQRALPYDRADLDRFPPKAARFRGGQCCLARAHDQTSLSRQHQSLVCTHLSMQSRPSERCTRGPHNSTRARRFELYTRYGSDS